MQFSRYIMQRISLQMRLKDSNFNIFHPFQRNTDVKSLVVTPLLRKVCLFSNLRLRFRSSSLRNNLVTPSSRFAR